jgi:hypothetical protein
VLLLVSDIDPLGSAFSFHQRWVLALAWKPEISSLELGARCGTRPPMLQSPNPKPSIRYSVRDSSKPLGPAHGGSESLTDEDEDEDDQDDDQEDEDETWTPPGTVLSQYAIRTSNRVSCLMHKASLSYTGASCSMREESRVVSHAQGVFVVHFTDALIH